nr:6-hydroxymethylpterin diphosphokinase MptE-like protein [uncultured Sulfurimonas sp.]
MQSVEDKAIDNYNSNMKFFEKEHSRLYKMLIALETLLNEAKYPQKYELEYKNGYFDVLEISSGNYLYNQNSKDYSKKIVDEISFKKNEQVFESSYNFIYDDNSIELLKDADAFFPHATTAPIIHYHKLNTNTSMNMNRIYKFIFLGVGLGLHIKDIVEKTKADIILITDNDIELFRLSMFTCNYKEALENKKVFFSIAQTSIELAHTFGSFFENAIIRNHYLKFCLFSSKDEPTIKQIQQAILIRPEKCYSHSRLLHKSKNILKRIAKDYKFVNLHKKELENFFDDKPILVLAAGPSLNAQKEWLQQNYKNFIIIAPLAALKTLYKLDIPADIVVHIDENEPLAKRELDSFENKDYFQNTIFIFTASVADIFFDTFEKEKIYLLEDRTSYKLNNCFIDAASVGEASYAIALAFSNSDLYLLGLDLALGDDGSTHAKDHSDHVNLDTSLANSISQSASLDTAVTQVKGNFRREVNTIPLLAMSIPVVDIHTTKLKLASQNIYNLSDGAYFQETIPLQPSEVTITEALNKKDLKTKLLSLFDKYSSKSLSEEELQRLKERQKRVKKYYEFLDTFREDSSSNAELFMKSYTKLLDSMVVFEQDELHQIMMNYLLISSTYVSDLFNTKELQNHKKHIKKIKKIIIALLEKIIKAYEQEISKVLNTLQ